MSGCKLPGLLAGLSEKQQMHVIGTLTVRCCPACVAPLPKRPANNAQ